MSRDYQRDLHRRNVKILRFTSFGNVLDTEKILEISRKISYGNPLGELTFHLSKKSNFNNFRDCINRKMSVVGLDIGSQTSFCGVARQGKIGFRINKY